jgi:hypothetical protein
MKKVHKLTYSFVLLTLALVVIYTILARLSVFLFPAGSSSVSVFYVAVASMILFTLGFGAYGAIAAYAGTLIG